MLYLDSGIHFHKVEIPVFIYKKLNSTYPFIADKLSGFYCCFAHFLAEVIGHKWRRSLLYQLLISPLDRAISFGKVTSLTILVSRNLYFYMPWLFDEFFHIHTAIAKRSNCFLHCRIP